MMLLTVVGARPQFVKAAAISRVIGALGGDASGTTPITEVMVHTGQHYDPMMSDVFFDELGIPAPEYHLAVGSSNHGEQTGEIMRRLEPIVMERQPDAVLVYGDTNSTLAGALVGAKLHIPIVHVEAGLRSFDRRMPEEINRVLTDHVSALLLCPSETAISNLAAEGITEGVAFTGDVMYDVMLRALDSLDGANPVIDRIHLDSGRYVVATMHRASNTDDPGRAAAVFEAFAKLADQGLDVVFPVHPRTRALAQAAGLPSNVHLIDPIGYLEMVGLIAGAHAVVTDSGGIQKEAAWLGIPCVTMRDETEWIETVAEGRNVVAGTDTALIVEEVLSAEPPRGPFGAYGQGRAANLVVDAVLEGLNP